MDVTAAVLVEGGRQARLCEAFDRNAGARGWKPLGRMTLGTPPGPSDLVFVSAGAGCKPRMERRKMAFTLSGASVCGRRGRAIRKKIYRTRHARFSGEIQQRKRLVALVAGVPVAPSASGPAWLRNSPPSKGREARQSPCGDWRHG
jgi:hypothetical protein